MAEKIIGRRPVKSTIDGMFYMAEVTNDMVYRVHHDAGIFHGFDTEDKCIRAYVEYAVNHFLSSLELPNLKNFDPEFSPECMLQPGQPALYSLRLFDNYLLVNNCIDKQSIVQWFIDKGTIVF